MLANVPRPGKSFAGLRRYLLSTKAANSDGERVAWIASRNLATDDPHIATKVMDATAALSVRVQRPVYHLIVSWHPDDQPDRASMADVAATTLADIGLAEHQALIVGHGDTRNPHLHMIVNRVHPETGMAWSTSHDYRRIEQSMRRQSESHGFQFVEGRHQAPQIRSPRRPKQSDGEYQMLRKKGRKSVAPWSQDQINALGERLRGVFDSANSWQELEEALEAFGGTLMPKGQGMILTDHTRTGFAKLSSFGEGIRFKELEKRFGERWDSFRASHPHPTHSNEASRPLVTEMDVVLGLYRIGLADREDVQKAAGERERRMTTLPVAKQIEREMAQALQSARKPPKRKAEQHSVSQSRQDR